MPPELASSPVHDPALLDATVPTVETKLLVPPTPRHLIIRKRLLDALDVGAQGPVVLVSAPAGAGKTILVASWIQTRALPGPVCWLSLDGDDNDASRLAADLLSALRGAGVVKRGGALDRLRAPVGARTDGFLASLVNGLSRLSSPFVLVLDDVHELTSPQAIAMIDFLVRHAPEQCRLVLVGRSDPAVPIERFRVSGALTELRVADLAFDREETGALYRQLDLGLSEAEIDLFWHRTEGWPAALRLAGLSLQSHPEPRRFVAEFAGTDRAVADYLVAEILAHVSADRREFMLRTSLVDTLTPELADALTGLEGGALTLTALEHSGAPVQKTHARGSWYRYHPLFRELLRAHLHHSHKEELALLHRRAARWHAEQGQVKLAIRHALAGEDWEHAGRLIEDNWLDLYLRGASGAVRDPMAKLPADVIAEHPRLAVALAGSRLEDGDWEGAEHYLSLAMVRRQESQPRAREELGIATAAVQLLRARMLVDGGEAERCSGELADLARTRAYHRWTRLRSFALSNLGATLLWAGDPSGAVAHLQEGLALAREDPCEHLEFDCLAQLAITELLSGELKRAGESAASAVEMAERHGWEDGPAPACAYLAGAQAAYWHGEFERAEGLVERAARAADRAELPVRLATGMLNALALAAAGPQSAARGTVKLRAVRAAIADGERIPDFLRVALEDAEPRVMIAAGDVEGARATLARAQSQMPDCAALSVRQAEVELHAGRPGQTCEILARALGESSAGPTSAGLHPATRLEAWTLDALAKQANGEPQAAARALDEALALAEQGRLRAPFLLGGPAMLDLLERHALSGSSAHPALLEALLDRLDGGSRAGINTALAQPLTERELKILRYLPTMLSNAEIGAETFVSLNTVKTHLRSIYRKLDASNRADAVERGRAAGLLPSGIRRPRVPRR